MLLKLHVILDEIIGLRSFRSSSILRWFGWARHPSLGDSCKPIHRLQWWRLCKLNVPIKRMWWPQPREQLDEISQQRRAESQQHRDRLHFENQPQPEPLSWDSLCHSNCLCKIIVASHLTSLNILEITFKDSSYKEERQFWRLHFRNWIGVNLTLQLWKFPLYRMTMDQGMSLLVCFGMPIFSGATPPTPNAPILLNICRQCIFQI